MVRSNLQPAQVDLSNCEREPIHIPGRIQPHGVLLALSGNDLRVTHASANAAELLGRPVDQLLDEAIDSVLPRGQGAVLRRRIQNEAIGVDPAFVGIAALGTDERVPYVTLVHRFKELTFVELEPAPAEQSGVALVDGTVFSPLHARLRRSGDRLQGAADVRGLCQAAAEEVRALTGFGRVMVYQFDEAWNGVVVAESRDEATMDSYLHHHFPAGDIPRQARDLYVLNRIRLIADASYVPADVVPTLTPSTGAPLDLSYAVLRSVSPIHLEYLQNMGVRASMSISIVRDGRLWGLVACHHPEPRFVPYDVRSACDQLAQIVALQLSAKENFEDEDYRQQLAATQHALLSSMADHDPFVEGLVRDERGLLFIAGATGAAVLMDGDLRLVGEGPNEEQVRAIVRWLDERPDRELFQTDCLSDAFPEAEAFKDVAAGLLAVSVPRYRSCYVMWFRPEVVRTIAWAGDPGKPAQTVGGEARLHPRKSFETWKQVVHRRSLPWKRAELSAAAALRQSIVGIVLKQSEELARLNADLRRSNKELEAFSYSVSHDLRAPFRHIVGFANLLAKREEGKLDGTSKRYIDTIAESARYAGTLVDGLLAFSQMGRKSLVASQVDLGRLVEAVRAEVVAEEGNARSIEWDVSPLPTVEADPGMLRLALRNLISNAVKYTRGTGKARIEIGTRVESAGGNVGDEHVVWVKDNGVGFDMAYADKLFGVFQRLHRVEEFEGTGIGLANVRRIVERHGGRTWAVGRPHEGAAFFLTLPVRRGPAQVKAADASMVRAGLAEQDPNAADRHDANLPR